jgi:hypothetical protein
MVRWAGFCERNPDGLPSSAATGEQIPQGARFESGGGCKSLPAIGDSGKFPEAGQPRCHPAVTTSVNENALDLLESGHGVSRHGGAGDDLDEVRWETQAHLTE